MTREVSNCTTATNYALEGDIRDRPSVPAIPSVDGINGPWLELIPNRTTSIPKYILTKTHCGGFCSYCPSDWFIETPRSFQIACQSGTQAIETAKGKIKQKLVIYDSKIVKKAIHIFRHPLDNIVARFHLDCKKQTRSGNLKNDSHWPELLPRNRVGFHQWCNFLDGRTPEFLDLHWIDRRLRQRMDKVPCRTEFFRYIQWHNNAFTTIHNMGISSLTVHYGDYETHFNQTIDRILHFLELPREGDRIVNFVPGKKYSDYYTEEQKESIYKFLEEFSSRETWDQLKVYTTATATQE